MNQTNVCDKWEQKRMRHSHVQALTVIREGGGRKRKRADQLLYG